MWQDRLKEIIYLLENSDVNEIDVTFLGRRYRVVKTAPVISQTSSAAPVHNTATPAGEPLATPESSAAPTTQTVEVLSPMPGTFYRAPAPEADPFVKVGDTVKKGDTLCIIEAMKIMNEIEAETSGVIKKIIAEDAQPVEYNQVLFLIEPT
jgi:acetyl-CoA carboxylase biotin carboxyl carrier protein